MSYSSYSSYNQSKQCCCKKGDVGPVGPTGSQGPQGPALIPYEPGPPQAVNTQVEISNNQIYYMTFFAPSSSTYTKAKIYTTSDSSVNDTIYVGVAIYDNSNNNPGNYPGVLNNSYDISYTDTSFNNTFLDFSLNATLTKDNQYWFAIGTSYNDTSGTISIGYRQNYDICYNLCYESSGNYDNSFGTNPAPAYESGLTDSSYAFWFRIS